MLLVMMMTLTYVWHAPVLKWNAADATNVAGVCVALVRMYQYQPTNQHPHIVSSFYYPFSKVIPLTTFSFCGILQQILA